MIQYFESDIKRINHALKVYGFASTIAREEKMPDNEIIIVDIAAILHDIGIKESERKYNSSAGHYQEIEGPPVARNLLSTVELPPEILDRVYYIIGNHHSFNKIDGLDFQIIFEADFLVNIFEFKMSKKSINNIRQKYFKTKTGISMLESMYIAFE